MRQRASGGTRARRLRRALPVLLLGLLALLSPASAFAEGGKTIAASTPVSLGQQEFGNTAEGQDLEGQACRYRSYWNVTATAGDLLTIDWEGTPGTELNLMPVGTTDFTLFQTEPVVHQEESSNHKNQATYTAPVSGSMPLYFRSCPFSSDFGEGQPGPYSFLVTDQHALVATIQPYLHLKTTTTVYGSAALAGGSPVPDGTSFDLTVSWPGNHLVQYAAASLAGGLAFPMALPEEAEGQNVTLAISRPADGTYQAVKSAEVTAKVAAPPPPAPPVRHHRKHHHRHRRHHHRHHRH